MFWGLIMEPHRSYTQKVERGFHISKAALDIFAASDEPAQVLVQFENKNYLLCTLQKNHTLQCDLDLNFDVGDEVVFATNGTSNVHLTGYIIDEYDQDEIDSDDEAEDEEVELEELTSKRKNSASENEVSVKKSKTAKLLEEISQNYNSDDDPTFNFSQDDDDIEADSDDDDEDEDEEDSDEDDSDELEALEISQDDVFVPTTNGRPKRTIKPPVETEAESPTKKTPKKKELNNGVTPKATPQNKATTPKVEGKTPKKTPGNQKENNPQNRSAKKQILEGGVLVEDLKEGEGKAVKAGKLVQVYYEGRLKNNNKVFDSMNKGPGFKFVVGKREVIKGWDLGLIGMKIGGKRRVTCPPNMAYGQKGSPPTIPPNSTLVFDIELKKMH